MKENDLRSCPKCGNRGFTSPRYISAGVLNPYGEHLVLACKTCGFTVREPTKDAAQ